MKRIIEPKHIENNRVQSGYSEELVCFHCGYDLDEAELKANTCSDCGKPLEVKQSVSVGVTSVPSGSGST